MKNKTLYVLIALTVLALLVTLPLLSSCGDKNEYHLEPNEVISNGLLFRKVAGGYELASFRRYGEENAGDVITVPSMVEGEPVIGISGADESSMVGIILPDTLTYIKSSFQHCYNLTTLQIPLSVTHIEGSFLPFWKEQSGCPKLVQAENGFLYVDNWIVGNAEPGEGEKPTFEIREGTVGIAGGVCVLDMIDEDERLVIPDGIKHIGRLSYAKGVSWEYDCISELVLPETIETIGEKAFAGAIKTEKPIVLKNVKRIGREAFSSGDYGDLIFSDTLEHIGEDAFCSSSIGKLDLGRGVTGWGAGVIDEAKIGELAVPSSLMDMIGRHSIENDRKKGVNDTTVGVLRITEGALSGTIYNGKIRSVILEEGVTKVGPGVFDECMALETLLIKGEDTRIDATAFLYCYKLKDVTAPADVLSMIFKAKLERAHVTKGVVRASDFANATALTDLTLGAAVTVEPGAFDACTALASVTLSAAQLDAIPKAGIKSLSITHVTALGAEMLSGFTALETITLPKTLQEISPDAFLGMTSLQNVYYNGTVAAWASIRFGNAAANPLSVAENLFINRELLTSVTGLTSLSPYAFYGYTKLTSLSLVGLTAIPEAAFYGCTGLVGIEIPAVLREIGPNAFFGCTALLNVAFGDTSGWQRYESAQAISGTEIYSYYLTNAESAAIALIDTYAAYVWRNMS